MSLHTFTLMLMIQNAPGLSAFFTTKRYVLNELICTLSRFINILYVLIRNFVGTILLIIFVMSFRAYRNSRHILVDHSVFPTLCGACWDQSFDYCGEGGKINMETSFIILCVFACIHILINPVIKLEYLCKCCEHCCSCTDMDNYN